MILPEKMCKVYVVGLKEKRDKIMKYIYSKGVMHLEESIVEGSDVSLSEKESEVLELKTKIDSLFHNLEGIVNLKEPKKISSFSPKDIKKLRSVVENIGNNLKKLESLREEINIIKEQYRVVEMLIKLNVSNLSHIEDIENHVVIVGYANKESSTKLKDAIKELKESYTIEAYIKEEKDKDYYLIISPKEANIGEIISLLDEHHDIKEIYEMFKNIETKTAKIYEYLASKVEELNNTYEKAITQIQKEYEKNKDLLWSGKEYVSMQVEMLEGYSKIKETTYVFSVNGYIPCKDVDNFIEGLKKIDKDALIKVEEVKENEDAPVKLKYPSILKGFHLLLEAYGLPKYRYFDPSLFMLFTFPLFYGFILGDFGYGLVLILLSWILMKKIKNTGINLLGHVMFFAGISTILFGIAFGEFFGFSEIFGIKLPYLMHRMDKITELIMISLLFGVVHINFGLMLGILQDIMYGKYLHALLHRGSWILLQIGIALIAYGIYSSTPLEYIGYALSLSAVVMLYKAEGLQSIFELPSIFTNILSYARLGAVGLSSIAIAYAINLFVEMFFATHTWWGYLSALTIFVLGHTFNILLGIISPFLHSLRLHYVEYFSKFYEGGGKKFVPYGKMIRR